tara:strand:- start:1358 stop:1951 length:594 start_codon:yes stop_codon:yes gene_type:complete
MRIICCRFGNKFNDWHVKNLKHMIDNYSGLKYDSFEIIENDLYGNWYNKLQMYDMFRDGENLYFDLDMVIYNKLPNLIRKDFTLLYDFWREGVKSHTPLNSSIVSWTGDVSHIWKKFKSNDNYYLTKYYKGSDEFYYKEIDYKTYDDVCWSIKGFEYDKKPNPKYSICTLGQQQHLMEDGWSGWWKDYFIKSKSTSF